MDFMTFLNSMGEIKKKKHSKKKSGSSKKRKVLEEECEKNGELEDICEITEEGSNDSDEEKVKGVVNSTIKEEASGDEEASNGSNGSGDSDDDEEGDEDSNESNDSDDDSQDSEDSDEDDEDEEDSDDDDDVINDKKLYNILNSFFVDENEVSIATSMSNISYELNKLNKNLSKLLKSKE
jgi:hypothetical protein